MNPTLKVWLQFLGILLLVFVVGCISIAIRHLR
jgi:NADH:ubiquinone oxidoreductase subunit 6 (subunit J)